MKAVVLHAARDLRLEDCHMPELSPGMVLLRVKRVGICGSDLHYFEYGYCGAFVPSQPFILGHEVTGEVVAVGDGPQGLLTIGSRVTVNPARSCGACEYCQAGRKNLCRKTVMLGSGSTTPPTNGAMAEYVVVRVDQCHLLPPGFDDGWGAMIEPLAVALHAVRRAGKVDGKRILVTGAGTIGLLTALTAKALGAADIALSDIIPERREHARKFGITTTIDPAYKRINQQLHNSTEDGFDIIFEASGSSVALQQCFDMIKAGGTIVQIGTIGQESVPLPANQLMVREIQLLGSFRYDDVFDECINLVSSGKIDVRPFITDILPMNDAVKAMDLAADKINALKIQLTV